MIVELRMQQMSTKLSELCGSLVRVTTMTYLVVRCSVDDEYSPTKESG